jgi:hypothetical protein
MPDSALLFLFEAESFLICCQVLLRGHQGLIQFCCARAARVFILLTIGSHNALFAHTEEIFDSEIAAGRKMRTAKMHFTLCAQAAASAFFTLCVNYPQRTHARAEVIILTLTRSCQGVCFEIAARSA